MSRKNPGLAEMLVLAPWWLSAFLGGAVFVGLRWIIPHFTATASNPIIKAIGSAVPGFAPLALFFCAVLAILSALFARRRRALVDKQTSLETLKSINWQEFEWLVGEAFRRQGYSVVVGLSRGADGGVDVVLRRDGQTTLVQCKHRKSTSVGVPYVRELFGVMTSERAHAAILITTGSFTPGTRAFAAGKPIRLIDGDELLSMVKHVQRPSEKVVEKPAPVRSPLVPKPETDTPSCPKCGVVMVRRKAKRGANAGAFFWGCPTYPKCTGTRAIP